MRHLLADPAMHAMAVRPAIEIRLLDTDGRAIAHALDEPGVSGTRIDPDAVRPLAARPLQTPARRR